jgi:hypothetical protein
MILKNIDAVSSSNVNRDYILILCYTQYSAYGTKEQTNWITFCCWSPKLTARKISFIAVAKEHFALQLLPFLLTKQVCSIFFVAFK